MTSFAQEVGPWRWGGGPWFPFFPLIPLFWLLLIGGLVFALVRWGRPHGPTGLERAREILAERFARGEISPNEYRERLEALR
jgi:putative membrane protein